MSNKKPAETAALKKELQIKLEIIREKEAALPDMIADLIPTKPYRDKVRDFMRVLASYIEGLDDKSIGDDVLEKPDEQGSDDTCAGQHENIEDLIQCYIDELAKYGVYLMDNADIQAHSDLGNPTLSKFDPSQLAAILEAVYLTGLMLVQYMRGLRIEGAPLTLTPQQAFRMVFGNIEFGYVPSRLGTGVTIPVGDSMNGNNPIYILLDDTSFESGSLGQSFVPIHELGHAFHNRHGGRTEYNLAPIAGFGFANGTGSIWNPDRALCVPQQNIAGVEFDRYEDDQGRPLRCDSSLAQSENEWVYIILQGSYIARGYENTEISFFPNELRGANQAKVLQTLFPILS